MVTVNPATFYSKIAGMGYGDQDDNVIDGCGLFVPIDYTVAGLKALLKTLTDHRKHCTDRWL